MFAVLLWPAVMPRANAAANTEITVFAAASLKDTLDEIGTAWQRKSGAQIRLAYAGSAKLARQIEFGAPADVFFSANVAWMKHLEQRGLIAGGSRRDLIANRLVLIAHGKAKQAAAAADPPPLIAPGFDLRARLKNERLAMAMIDAVPAGIYGKAALTSLGIWKSVSSQIAQTDNVRAALILVSRGEAPFGIVYATDAAASKNVTVIGRFPPASHPPIIYPAAMVADSANKALARDFLAFLITPAAQRTFRKHGFLPIKPTPSN